MPTEEETKLIEAGKKAQLVQVINETIQPLKDDVAHNATENQTISTTQGQMNTKMDILWKFFWGQIILIVSGLVGGAIKLLFSMAVVK